MKVVRSLKNLRNRKDVVFTTKTNKFGKKRIYVRSKSNPRLNCRQ